MKKFFVMLSVIFILVASAALAQSPSPSPSAAPAISAPSAPSGLAGWINSQGGLIAAVTVIVACMNILLSGAQQMFGKLAMAEPSWLQSFSSVMLKIAQFLGSNPPTPPASGSGPAQS